LKLPNPFLLFLEAFFLSPLNVNDEQKSIDMLLLFWNSDPLLLLFVWLFVGLEEL